jgi:hypothetical protein
MRIIDRDARTIIPGNSNYADAIRIIIRAFKQQRIGDSSVPERNDIKTLWPQLQDNHKQLLRIIAQQQGTTGVTQPVLEKKLGVGWVGLRGIHNGLARISAGLEIENPVRTIGYNRSNRRYQVDASTAETVISRWKRENQ